MVMTAGRSKGTPGGDKGWLPLPGRPVSGLASANTMTLGEEFLDGEVEDWESLRSMSCVLLEERGKDDDDGPVCLDLIPFLSFTD